MAAIEGAWAEALKPEFSKPYYRKLFDFVKEAYSREVVYPPSDEIFTAFHLTPLEKVRVVILGQDPYHEPGQAHGLAFSVRKGVEPPPSLVNIFQELHADLGLTIPDHGDLTDWAKQGVLLLNSCLTVRAHQASSHANAGWEEFTDAAIRAVETQARPIVYILWGKFAERKKALITRPDHFAIASAHPSPLSAYRGFFGSRPFSRANAFLRENGVPEVDWSIGNKE